MKRFEYFTPGQRKWLLNIKRTNPRAYRAAVVAYDNAVQSHALGGLGAIDWGGIFATVTKAAKQVAPSLIELKKSRDALALQKKQIKAESGIRAASISAGYGDPGAVYSQQTAQYPADYSAQYPQGYQQYGQSYGGFQLDTKTMLMIAGGLALVFLLIRKNQG